MALHPGLGRLGAAVGLGEVAGLFLQALLGSPGGRPIDLVHVSDAVNRGLYAAQLRRVLDHFPREQVLVLQFERCVDEPLEELSRTWRFLGLEPLGAMPPSMLEWGPTRPKPELPQRWRRELVARLVDDVRDLAAEFPDEIDPDRWKSFAGQI